MLKKFVECLRGAQVRYNLISLTASGLEPGRRKVDLKVMSEC